MLESTGEWNLLILWYMKEEEAVLWSLEQRYLRLFGV